MSMHCATYHGTITNAGGNVDLFSVQPADDVPVRVRGVLLSQISEVSDAAEEGLQITVNRLPATFTVGSGGGAVTATKNLDNYAGGAVWQATVRANDTTVATTSGTLEEVGAFGWNERNSPYDFFYPDERFAPASSQAPASPFAKTPPRRTTTPAFFPCGLKN
jgi:hypothetical protein